MPNAFFYSNIASAAQLNGGIDSAVVTAVVDTTAGWPGSYPFVIALDYGGASEELVRVDNNSSNTLTIVRGFGGTNAVSHSAGAVVRHVHNAVDDTDFRTHEAATSAVHGVISTLVGTDDTQTLTNKTIDHPGIITPAVSGGGSLAGTFTGAPTFSGNLTFSGTPSFTNGAALAGTFSGTPTYSGLPSFIAGIAVSGSNAGVTRSSATDLAFRSLVTADAANRWQVAADGRQSWGDGTALDTNLYRSAADTLKTDDSFVIGGNLTAANMDLGASHTWTPTWTTSTGAHTPTFGNADVEGSYSKIGRLLFFNLLIVFGSTTNFGSGTNADNWLFSIPNGLTAASLFANSVAMCGAGRAAQSNLGTVPVTVRVEPSGTKFSLDMAGGRVDGASPPNTGNLDSVTPWNWASGNILTFSGVVEVTT